MSLSTRQSVMFGFKRFSNATVVIAGAEPAHRIRKGQFDFVELGFTETVVPAVSSGPAYCTMK